MSAKYDKQLLYFCKVGDVSGVTKIVTNPNPSLDLNCKDQDGMTPLLLAASTNKIEIVQLLINAGANVDIVSKDSNSPLHLVSKDGRMEIVKSLLAAKANPNIKNEQGNTALHEACRYGKSAIVQLLLEAGAQIDAQDEKLYTPLHTASFYQQSDVMKILISSGSNIDLKDKNGQMAVEIASPERKHDKLFENQKLLESNTKRRSIIEDGNNNLLDSLNLGALSVSFDAGDNEPISIPVEQTKEEEGGAVVAETSSGTVNANVNVVASSPSSSPHQDRPLPAVENGIAAEDSEHMAEQLNAVDGSRVSSYRSSTNSLSPIQIVIHVAEDEEHSGGSSNASNSQVKQTIQHSHSKIDSHKDSLYVASLLTRDSSESSSFPSTIPFAQSTSERPSNKAPPAAPAASSASASAPVKSKEEPVQTAGCCIIS